MWPHLFPRIPTSPRLRPSPLAACGERPDHIADVIRVRGRLRELIRRHCERSEAIHPSPSRAMDCFASLALTRRKPS